MLVYDYGNTGFIFHINRLSGGFGLDLEGIHTIQKGKLTHLEYISRKCSFSTALLLSILILVTLPTVLNILLESARNLALKK